jgi:hypothetical protein
MTNHLEDHRHAFIKNGIVINVAVFDGHDSELLQSIINDFNLDEIVCCCNHGIPLLNSKWNGIEFTPPAPYPSWVWDSTLKTFIAPVEYPSDDNVYLWNEESNSWVLM